MRNTTLRSQKLRQLTDSEPQGGSKDTRARPRPKAELSVSIAEQSVPKLPHEHDESVECQEGGPKPATENSNAAPGIQRTVRNSG